MPAESDDRKRAPESASAPGASEPRSGAEREAGEPGPAPADPPGSAEALEEVARERDEYLDNWKRERASFLNYKRWVEKERRNWETAAACRLVETLLPFIDDVDRALLAAGEAVDAEALQEGFRLIARSFHDALARAGIEEIRADGAPFDPRFHEAILQVEDADRPHGTVTETTQRGFRVGERLIRASKVVVSRAPESEPEPGAADDETRNQGRPGGDPSPPEADSARESNSGG